MPLYIVREGDGEQEALPTLVHAVRARLDLTLPHHHHERHSWKKPLLTEAHVRGVGEQLRAKEDCEAVLLTRDADNVELAERDCPKHSAPAMATWIRDLRLPFPASVVLFYKEYETLFVAGADGMAGKAVTDERGRPIATIPAVVTAHPDPEYERDAKKWVRHNLVPRYSPTLLQQKLTRLLDHDDLDAKGLSSYRRLVRALQFLADHAGEHGAVYPPSTSGGPR